MNRKDLYRSFNAVDDAVLERSEATHKLKKSPARIKWIAVAACFAIILTVAVSVGYKDDYVLSPSELSKPQHPQGTIEHKDIIWGQSTNTNDEGLSELNGKELVKCSLYEALKTAGERDVFAVSAVPMLNDEFIYNGKTLKEYRLLADKERNFPAILWELLKEGEELKYGEILYKGGTPDGTKWSRELYEERVNYYGKEILDTYIKDGVFLADQVRSDIAAYDKHTDQDTYQQACDSFMKEMITSAQKQLERQHFSFTSSQKSQGLIMFLTADQFTSLQLNTNTQWLYGLALKEGEPDDL